MPMSSDDLTRRHQRFHISRRAAKIRQGLPFGEETSAVGLGLSNKIAVRSSELNGNPSQPISKRKQIGTEDERMHLSRRRHRMHESKDRQRPGRDHRASSSGVLPLTDATDVTLSPAIPPAVRSLLSRFSSSENNSNISCITLWNRRSLYQHTFRSLYDGGEGGEGQVSRDHERGMIR